MNMVGVKKVRNLEGGCSLMRIQSGGSDFGVVANGRSVGVMQTGDLYKGTR